MPALLPVARFYARPFLLLVAVNLLLYLLLGTYFEEYEGFFSTILQGTYTLPGDAWWDTTNHFLILFLYESLIATGIGYNVFGWVLFLYNWASLLLLGLVLYRVLTVNLRVRSLALYILLYLVLVLDHSVNLNSTRIAFVFIAAVLGYIESRRLEHKTIRRCEWAGLLALIAYISLIRFEAVVVASGIYIFLLLLFRRFRPFALLPALISGGLLIVSGYLNAHFASEAKQAFIYKERELYDRGNIDHENLTAAEKLELEAIFYHNITDREFFTLAFYDSIARPGAAGPIPGMVANLHPRNWMPAVYRSAHELWLSRHYALFFALTAFYLFLFVPVQRRKLLLYAAFTVALPLLLSLYTIVPMRFLVPYITALSVLNILLILRRAKIILPLLAFTGIFLLFFLQPVSQARQFYIEEDAKFRDVSRRLQLVDKDHGSKEPVVISHFLSDNFFPVRPLGLLPRQHALFLNFYYFASYGFYREGWTNVCGCDPLTVRGKVDYMVRNSNVFLVETTTFDFLQRYFREKYGLDLQRKDVRPFDTRLESCVLYYGTAAAPIP